MNAGTRQAVIDVLKNLIAEVESADTVSAFLNADQTIGSNMNTINLKLVITGKE
jgi:hypothetical protein